MQDPEHLRSGQVWTPKDLDLAALPTSFICYQGFDNINNN